MTLFVGDRLAKIDADGKLIEGEMQHIFSVNEIEHLAENLKKAVLEVVE